MRRCEKEKSRSKKQSPVGRPLLNMTGLLEMPSDIQSWERNLLAVLLEAVALIQYDFLRTTNSPP